MADPFELTFEAKLKGPDELDKPQQIMLYSAYGAGKSWLAASASQVEELSPVLVIDNEGSTTGALGDFDPKKVKVMRIKDEYPGNEWRAFEAILEELLTKPHGYKTVVIDPLNSAFEWAKVAGDVRGDGFAKWNFVHEKFTAEGGLIDRLKNAPFLSVLVVHEKKEGGDEDTPAFADFRWQGQGVGFLGQYPDIIGYLTRDTNAAGVAKSTLFTSPTKKNNAKNRFGLPAKMENPSMKAIFDYIATNKKENN